MTDTCKLGKHSQALFKGLGRMAEERPHKMKASTSGSPSAPLCSSPAGTFPDGPNSSSRKFMFPRRFRLEEVPLI